MPGETSETSSLDDARHWARVYAQLLEFKEQVLAETKQGMSQMEPDARSEVGRTDAQVLEAERRRLQRRADFWERKQRQLGGAPAQP